MRSRNIKPGFFKNEDLCEIEPIGRLLFEGLWCIADREGRLQDRPRKIWAEILPYDPYNGDELLWQLHDKGFIVRYEVGLRKFIFIPTFKAHQNPHHNESSSVLPDVSAGCTTSRHGSKSLLPCPVPAVLDSLIPGFSDSLNPGTTSPQPPSGGPVAVPPVRKKRQKRTISQIETLLGVTRLPWWVEFWSIYPCHEDKRSAMDAFERVVTTVEIWEKVLAGAKRYRQKADANPELTLKYGQGWLNSERWEDEDGAVRGRASPKVDPVAALMQKRIDEGWQCP